jgi:uncharacterized protein (DUF924 family)
MMDNNRRIDAIHDFWFGSLDANGMPAEDRRKLWYGGDRATDAAILDRFGSDVEDALAGRRGHWVDAAGGLIALVLLLDQFTRNIFRDSPRAFSGDPQALSLARAAVASGRDRGLPTIHRVFLYTPFEHAEEMSAQNEGVDCFARLLEECPEGARDRIADFQRYMLAHRDVIAKFDRFPHRNAVLGRESSAAELAHLQIHGGF